MGNNSSEEAEQCLFMVGWPGASLSKMTMTHQVNDNDAPEQ